jgi:D-tyrosyl-tRNA(Tyr) deacylase
MDDAEYCARKVVACKLWENDNGAPWRQSVKQKGYDVLLVSQFTLYGRLTKKHQPDYQDAMKSIPAAALYSDFVDQVRQAHTTGQVCDGVFGAMMDVALVNDGPVTILIESPTSSKGDSDGSVAATTTATVDVETATTASVTTTEDGGGEQS